MRVVQVSPFSVIQRSPPVSLPPPEILSDRFLFCRMARKNGSPPPFYRGRSRRRPQTGRRRPFPANRRSMAAAIPAFLLIYTVAVPALPKHKNSGQSRCKKAIIMFSNSPSADCLRKTASPIGAPRRGDAPLRRFSRDSALQNRILTLREALRLNQANGREGCLQPDQ